MRFWLAARRGPGRRARLRRLAQGVGGLQARRRLPARRASCCAGSATPRAARSAATLGGARTICWALVLSAAADRLGHRAGHRADGPARRRRPPGWASPTSPSSRCSSASSPGTRAWPAAASRGSARSSSPSRCSRWAGRRSLLGEQVGATASRYWLRRHRGSVVPRRCVVADAARAGSRPAPAAPALRRDIDRRRGTTSPHGRHRRRRQDATRPPTYAVGREKIREYALRRRRDQPAAPRRRGRARAGLSRRRRAADVRRRLQRAGDGPGDLRPRGRHQLRADGPRRPGVHAGARSSSPATRSRPP